MKTKATLVRAKAAVELNAETAVYLNFALIVYPRNAEHNNTLWFYKALKQSSFFIFWMCLNNRLQGSKNFGNCLNKFRFVRVLSLNLFDNGLYETHKFLLEKHSTSTYGIKQNSPIYKKPSLRNMFETKHRGMALMNG